MNYENARIWTGRLLLGFVLITIGFAAGRRTAPPSPDNATGVGAGITRSANEAERRERVTVYAAHMTFRCPTCTQIEWLARELIENEFADELADGSLEFRTVDYLRDTDFADKYNISSSTIVVVPTEDETEQGFQRLDDVWLKIRDREAYFAYLRSAIEEALDGKDDQ